MKIIRLLPLLFLSPTVLAKNKKINTGYWHTTFTLNETATLPVGFMVEKEKRTIKLFVINADERIEIENIRQKKDSVFVTFPAFESEIKAKINRKNKITGAWYNYAKGKDYSIPFISTNGYEPRFAKQGSQIEIYGKWEVTFNYDTQPEKALGLFDPINKDIADNNKDNVKGTFLTETGDYRFLEGVVSNDSLYLSTFDGSHAFLFRSKLVNDTLWGEFLSGTHYKTNWYAIRNEQFELTDPDSLTYLVNEEPVQLHLVDINNERYVYPNSSTKGKVTLIQIMGTWCPNCLDESRYLAQQKNRFGNQLEIIAVTFETQPTLNGRIEKVKRYKEQLDLNYTFLIGGKASKSAAGELFPMLNHIISFPTLIFIDKEGKIRRIHTGFNGPGTGIYYDMFVEKTNLMLEQLVAE